MSNDLLSSAGLSRDEIDNLLSPKEVNNQNKELLAGETKNDIRTKTRLSDEEIKMVALANHYAKVVKSKKLSSMISDLLFLKVSKDSLSRKEYVDALKSDVENKGGGFFNKMFGGNNQ